MPDKKGLIHHTFYPALVVILAICALIAVYAYSVWPTDQELSPTTTTVIHKAKAKSATTNTNTKKTTNTNTVTN